MKKLLSLLVLVIGISLISITGSGCKSRNQNQANDSVVSEKSSDELTQFRKKFTIENVQNLLGNPKNKSLAQKCGLDFIYEEEDTGGEIDCFEVVYGYDVEKGSKKDCGYDINASSQHAVYLKYEESSGMGWIVYFKSKEDVDYFINEAKKHGFSKTEYYYTNGNWAMTFNEILENNGWFYFFISKPEESGEDIDSSNTNNDEMSESNKQKTLEYMSELQQIANEIDNIYNTYVGMVSSGNLDPMAHGNLEIKATQNISKLSRQAESIWDKLIALARETGGDVRALQEEKKKYLGDAYRMQMSLHSAGMNTDY